MRFVIIGVGAIGGVLAARMVLAGHDVVGVARGEHGRVIERDGMRLETPVGHDVVRFPVVERVDLVDWRRGDVAVLAVKGQHTVGVLDELRAAAGARSVDDVAVVSAQNGVANEREALRRFASVYGICVMSPCGFTEPGVVAAYSHPTPGILDLGRVPSGVDEVALEIASAFRSSGYESEAIPDVMRWKYRKLIVNLPNAVEVLCGPSARRGRLAEVARAEGERCLAAAGIEVATEAEDAARRGDHLVVTREASSGSSTWQSVQRGSGSVETDLLNGEIVLLGRLHGVATPVNELLQRAVSELVWSGREAGIHDEADLLGSLGHDT